MEGAVTDNGADRRRSRRHEGSEDHGVVSMQVRPGNRAMLINISAGGALIETAHRLLPGASVDLLLERSHYRASVRGRVLRCAVVRVHPASMCYRGAIRFDRSLPWFVEQERIDATQQVV
jgi:PilZ domain-containing protein